MRICGIIAYMLALILGGLWGMDREGGIELGSFSEVISIGWLVMLALGFLFSMLYHSKKEKEKKIK